MTLTLNKRIIFTALWATIPTLIAWFVLQDLTAIFTDPIGRFAWLGFTALAAIGCYTYPGWKY